MEKLHANLSTLFQAIETCLERRLALPALMLIYSGIDVVAAIERRPDEGTRSSFTRWVDRYMLPPARWLAQAWTSTQPDAEFSTRCPPNLICRATAKLLMSITLGELPKWMTSRQLARFLGDQEKMPSISRIFYLHLAAAWRTSSRSCRWTHAAKLRSRGMAESGCRTSLPIWWHDSLKHMTATPNSKMGVCC